ncbi:MAG: acetylxylan esterase [Cytophagia bacterium]|nr:acetylxylan esterase [Cytophagia bacterium]
MKKAIFIFILLFVQLSSWGQIKRTPEQDSLIAQTNRKTKWDHENMLAQLGITSLRSGASGTATAPNAANYDESKAVVFPNLPALLITKGGQQVTSKKMWEKVRRPELVEEFDREIYGRVPSNTPKVQWVVVSTKDDKVGNTDVTVQKLQGIVDNSIFPSIEVKMDLTLTLPKQSLKPVPVIVELSFVFPAGMRPPVVPNAPVEPTWQEQVISRGWGYATIIPTSIQADNGAGLTKGIIGLMNKGQNRKADDWGSLRAWAWGTSRMLDFFATQKQIDAKKIALMGHSRYGKAVAVAMAYDPRFATAFVSSSGEGGLKIHRRNYGEKVENVTGSGEYHWMAGNFIKYGGPLQWSDLPVDAHELLALCAPRPVFVGAGSTGDLWVDPKGMFEACLEADPAYRLYGKVGIEPSEFPPIGTGILTGQIAWRQHEKGHTPGPNWPFFLDFATKHFK